LAKWYHNYMKKFFSAVLSLAGFLIFPGAVLASTLSLSPGGGTVGVGGALSVRVVLNAGRDSVNGISAYLSYPQDKLDVSYVSPGGSFPIEAENSFGGGIIKISRGSINAVGGSVTVATIGFKGKSQGSATVSFIGGSAAPRASDSSDSLSLGGSSGGNFTVGGAAAPPTSSNQTAQNAPAGEVKTAIPPKLSDIKVLKISTDSATVSWKTERETDSLIDYGLDKDKYFLSASDGHLSADHSITLTGPLLSPGAAFHFKVTSKDADGSSASSQDMTFQLLGYHLKLRLINSSHQPLAGADVKLYSDAIGGKTDSTGTVEFNNVTMGKHLLVVKMFGLEKTAEIEVKNTPEVQGFDVNLDLLPVKPAYYQIIPFVAGGLILVVVLVAAVILLRRRKKILPPAPSAPGR